MLVLTRTKNTSVRIGGEITVTVLGLGEEEVAVQIDYPPGLALRGPAGGIHGEPIPAQGPSGIAPPGLKGFRALLPMRIEDTLSIGEDITMMVVDIRGGVPDTWRARLGFDAPRSIEIARDNCGQGRKPSTGADGC